HFHFSLSVNSGLTIAGRTSLRFLRRLVRQCLGQVQGCKISQGFCVLACSLPRVDAVWCLPKSTGIVLAFGQLHGSRLLVCAVVLHRLVCWLWCWRAGDDCYRHADGQAHTSTVPVTPKLSNR